jgi:hypothetical protein
LPLPDYQNTFGNGFDQACLETLLTGDLDFTKMVLVDIPQEGQVLQRMELSYIHTVEQLSLVFFLNTKV